MIAAGNEIGRRDAAAPARLLGFAATPVFAGMALLTWLEGGDAGMICSMHAASPLGGMVPMYLLMSAFHATPWLKLILRR